MLVFVSFGFCGVTLGVRDGVDCCAFELDDGVGANEIAIGCNVPF